MKSVTLVIDKKEQKFTIPFVNGFVWRTWIELQEKVKNPSQLTLAEIDKFVELVVMAFENQFTLEEFYKGIPYDKVMATIESLFIPDNDEAVEGNGKK